MFPDVPRTKAGRDSIGWVLWNATGYPSFYNPETWEADQTALMVRWRDTGKTALDDYEDEQFTRDAIAAREADVFGARGG